MKITWINEISEFPPKGKTIEEVHEIIQNINNHTDNPKVSANIPAAVKQYETICKP